MVAPTIGYYLSNVSINWTTIINNVNLYVLPRIISPGYFVIQDQLGFPALLAFIAVFLLIFSISYGAIALFLSPEKFERVKRLAIIGSVALAIIGAEGIGFLAQLFEYAAILFSAAILGALLLAAVFLLIYAWRAGRKFEHEIAAGQFSAEKERRSIEKQLMDTKKQYEVAKKEFKDLEKAIKSHTFQTFYGTLLKIKKDLEATLQYISENIIDTANRLIEQPEVQFQEDAEKKIKNEIRGFAGEIHNNLTTIVGHIASFKGNNNNLTKYITDDSLKNKIDNVNNKLDDVERKINQIDQEIYNIANSKDIPADIKTKISSINNNIENIKKDLEEVEKTLDEAIKEFDENYELKKLQEDIKNKIKNIIDIDNIDINKLESIKSKIEEILRNMLKEVRDIHNDLVDIQNYIKQAYYQEYNSEQNFKNIVDALNKLNQDQNNKEQKLKDVISNLEKLIGEINEIIEKMIRINEKLSVELKEDIFRNDQFIEELGKDIENIALLIRNIHNIVNSQISNNKKLTEIIEQDLKDLHNDISQEIQALIDIKNRIQYDNKIEEKIKDFKGRKLIDKNYNVKNDKFKDLNSKLTELKTQIDELNNIIQKFQNIIQKEDQEIMKDIQKLRVEIINTWNAMKNVYTNNLHKILHEEKDLFISTINKPFEEISEKIRRLEEKVSDMEKIKDLPTRKQYYTWLASAITEAIREANNSIISDIGKQLDTLEQEADDEYKRNAIKSLKIELNREIEKINSEIAAIYQKLSAKADESVAAHLTYLQGLR